MLHVLDVAADDLREQQAADARRRRCRRTAITAPSRSTRVSRCRGADPIASRMPNSRVRALTENASTPATPTTAIMQRHAGEAAEDQRVQPIRREHFGAHVLERRRPLDRLIGRQLADDARDRRHQRVRIGPRVHEQAAAADLLLERVIDGHRRPGTTFSSSTSAATPTMRRGSALTSMNFITGSVHINRRLTRVLVREHPLRQALADDHDLLGVAAIGVVEVAAGDDRHAERREESGRDGAEPRRADPLRRSPSRSPRP